MKICFPIEEDNGLDSRISDHFGSAAKLMVIDTETEFSITFHNSSRYHGDRCIPLSAMRGMLIDGVVADAISERALKTLHLQGVEVFPRPAATISGALHLMRSGKFSYITTQPHRSEANDNCPYHANCPDCCSSTGVCKIDSAQSYQSACR